MAMSQNPHPFTLSARDWSHLLDHESKPWYPNGALNSWSMLILPKYGNVTSFDPSL